MKIAIVHDWFVTNAGAEKVLKNIVARKDIGNSKNEVINEYIDMLKKGYGSIQAQVDVFGGDKFASVVYTAEKRLKKYEGGTFFVFFNASSALLCRLSI